MRICCCDRFKNAHSVFVVKQFWVEFGMWVLTLAFVCPMVSPACMHVCCSDEFKNISKLLQLNYNRCWAASGAGLRGALGLNLNFTLLCSPFPLCLDICGPNKFNFPKHYSATVNMTN